MKLLCLLLILVSCASQKSEAPQKHYTLKLFHQEYSLVLDKNQDGTLNLTSNILAGDSSLPLSLVGDEPRVYEGAKNKEGNFLHMAGEMGIVFTEILMVPYYGRRGYNIISHLRKYEDGIYNPDCPLNTTYLIVFQLNHGPLPLFGCVF